MGGRDREPALDQESRARIRRKVLAGVPQAKRRSDVLYGYLAAAGLPAGALGRAAAALALVATLVASVTVAGADAMPGEPLYRVKVAAEEARRGLASIPEDLASVEMSIARHRLAEAVQLAGKGREAEAAAAASAYGHHVAEAAAALAPAEQPQQVRPPEAVVQLRSAVSDQASRASAAAERIVQRPIPGRGAAILRTAAATPAPAGDAPEVVRLAEHGASVAREAAEKAETAAKESKARKAERRDREAVEDADEHEPPERSAERARREADRAKDAAEKAKEAAKERHERP